MTQLPPLLTRFACIDPIFVAETPIATIWQVTRTDNSPAALKIYKDGDMQDEALGFVLQAAWDGAGAALVYDQTDGAVLLEWLDGPSLGDMVRAGQDIEATDRLGDVATRLHAATPSLAARLPRLEDEFAPLIKATFSADCPADHKRCILTAQSLATSLLTTQTDLRPLHRDLHHDNVKGSVRGFLAFDAKGVIGERAYDLANAFRNPIGAEETYCDPAVISRRLATWAQRFDVAPDRLLSWAIAHAGLSQAWTCNGTFSKDILSIDPAGCRFIPAALALRP